MDEFLEKYNKSREEIRREYPNFKEFGDVWMFEIYGQICEQQILKEFISQTINVEKTIETLESKFDKNFSSLEPGTDFIKIKFDIGIKGLFPNQFEYIKDIIKFMESFGWYASKIDGFKFSLNTLQNKRSNQNAINIKFEPKFDVEVNLSGYYYHITPDLMWDGIKNRGLTPKSKSKIHTHPERVYLIKKYNIPKFKELAISLYNTLDYRQDIKNKIKKYYVLRIDVDGLKKSGRDKFYEDPNYSLGVWTYENIPPIYIKKIDEISVNNN